jgi:hypothetical protein
LVFPYPAVHGVGTGKPASEGGFYPFVPGGHIYSTSTCVCVYVCMRVCICVRVYTYFFSPQII